MLELKDVSFCYEGDSKLFDRINLTVKPGEVIGLYGKSGIGKTTLAKIAAGYQEQDEGAIVVDGETYPFKGPNPVQLIGQHPEKAVNPKWRMEKVLAESGQFSDNFLRKLGIKEEWMHRFPSQLSGGELQRFCVARAMAGDTKYLIADEMTTMLDAINQAQIWQRVLQLIEKRWLGMLAISHDLPLLKKTCDRLLSFEELM